MDISCDCSRQFGHGHIGKQTNNDHEEEQEREIVCVGELGCQLDPRHKAIDNQTGQVVIGGGFVAFDEPEVAIPLKSGSKKTHKSKPKRTKKTGGGSKARTSSTGLRPKPRTKSKKPAKAAPKKTKTSKKTVGKKSKGTNKSGAKKTGKGKKR